MSPRHERPEMADLMRAPPAVQRELLTSWGLPPVALLLLESPCEGHCTFCANAGVRNTPLSPSQRALTFAAQVTCGTLCIGGNEPATHPAFLGALEQTGAEHIQVMTSGLHLARDAVAWRDLGVTSIATPIYGSKALHERVTGMDHGQLVEGLLAARDAGLGLHLHTLALAENLNGLGDLALFAQDLGVRLVVAPARAKDDVWDYATGAPTLDAVRDALGSLEVDLLGWPRCVLPDHPRGGADVIRIYFHGQARGFGPACAHCPARPECDGVVEGELRHRGAEGLVYPP